MTAAGCLDCSFYGAKIGDILDISNVPILNMETLMTGFNFTLKIFQTSNGTIIIIQFTHTIKIIKNENMQKNYSAPEQGLEPWTVRLKA